MPELPPPRCRICRDAGWLRAPGPLATAVKCVCQRRPEPETPERTERSCPPANVVPLRAGRRRG